MTSPEVVVVDHHDSYTWNLVHLVAAVTGVLPVVVEHDEVGPEEVLRFSHVVLSPGPGHPAVTGQRRQSPLEHPDLLLLTIDSSSGCDSRSPLVSWLQGWW